MKNLNDLMDHILYQIFKITLNLFLKKHGEKTDTLSLRTYVNEKENRLAFRIKTRYYLKVLTPEMMKLFGSTKSMKTKDKNGEKCLLSSVLLVHCNIVNNEYKQN